MNSGPVIGVISGCGGAGGSFFAAALASVAARASHPTFLLDCDPLGGGIDVLLGCEREPGPRWGQVRLRGGSLDSSVLVDGLPNWHGVSFLAADSPAELEPGVVTQLLEAAARGGPVVIDMPRARSPLRDGLSERCTRSVLVTPAEVRAVTASAVVAAGLDPSGTSVVVRGSSRVLTANRIGELLGLPVAGELPHDPASSRPDGLDPSRLRRGTLRVATAVLSSCRPPAVAA